MSEQGIMKALKKIAVVFVSLLFNLGSTGSVIITPEDLSRNYENGMILPFLMSLFLGLSIASVLMNSIVMTMRFDKFFKKDIIENGRNAFIPVVSPFVSSILVELRLFRGMIYSGTAFLFLIKKEPTVELALDIYHNKNFHENINSNVIILCFFQVALGAVFTAVSAAFFGWNAYLSLFT